MQEPDHMGNKRELSGVAGIAEGERNVNPPFDTGGLSAEIVAKDAGNVQEKKSDSVGQSAPVETVSLLISAATKKQSDTETTCGENI